MPPKFYNGRVEYRAIQNDVEEKVAAGFSGAQIYNELFTSGKITMSYSNFMFYLRGNGVRQPGDKKLKQLKNSRKPQIQNKPSPFSGTKNLPSFKHNNEVDLKELGPPSKDDY